MAARRGYRFEDLARADAVCEHCISMSQDRVVHAACPHDCPDTCAMIVTVDGEGRAVGGGDPDQPVTHGFLCGKVSNYLDRVYSPERVLHPLFR